MYGQEMGITCQVRLYELVSGLMANCGEFSIFVGFCISNTFSFFFLPLTSLLLLLLLLCYGVSTSVHTSEWRPEVSIRHLLQSLSILVFETGCLTEASAHGFG